MYYKMKFTQVDLATNKEIKTHVYEYIQSYNKETAVKQLLQERNVKTILSVKEVSEETYNSVYNENSNPMFIHGLPKEIHEFFS